MPVPAIASRYINLLRGGNLKRLLAESVAVSNLSKANNIPTVKAMQPYSDELAKVIGTYAGTGAVLGGAAYGVHKLTKDDPTVAERMQQSVAKSKVGKLMSMLGIKTAQDLETARQQQRASIIAMLAPSAASPLIGSVTNHAIKSKPDRELVERLLELSKQHHNGIEDNPIYAFDSRTRKILAPGGVNSDPTIVAHELGHAHDRSIPRLAGLPSHMSNIGGNLGIFGAAAMPDRESSKDMAIAGSALTMPTLVQEAYASGKGAKLLRQASKTVPMSKLLRAFSGLPSYGAMAAAPWLAYGIRSHMNGFGDRPKPTKLADTESDKSLASRLAVSGIAAKGIHDIGSIQGKLKAYESGVRALNNQPATISRSIGGLKMYGTLGNDILNSRVLGVKVNPIVRELNPVVEGRYAALWRAIRAEGLPQSSRMVSAANKVERGLQNINIEPWKYRVTRGITRMLRSGQNMNDPNTMRRVKDTLRIIRESRNHYNTFANKDIDHVVKHLIDEQFGMLPGDVKNRMGSAFWAVHGGKPQAPFSYTANLIRTAPTSDKSTVFKAINDAARINVFGPNTRISNYQGIAKKVLPAAKGLGVAAIGAAMYPYIRDGINSMRKNADSDTNAIMPASLTGGAAIAAHGIHTLRRPLDVGITWGEPPKIGAGHKTPGNVLLDLLRGQQSKSDFRLTKAVRGSDNSIIAKQPSWYKGVESPRRVRRLYDVLFDTGMGAGTPDLWLGNPELKGKSLISRVLSGINRPRARLSGHVGYTTDIPGNGFIGGDSASYGRFSRGTGLLNEIRGRIAPSLLQDSVITYGPPKATKSDNTFRTYRSSNLISPLLKPDAMDAIRESPSRDAVLSELLSDSTASMSDNSRNLLSKMHKEGRRVLVISGSGRGDQVAARAILAQRRLERIGMADKAQIVALLGNSKSYTPLAHMIESHPKIASIGFVGKKGLFPQLPLLGHAHWGSTGTMSGYESLASPVPYMQTERMRRYQKAESNFVQSPKGKAEISKIPQLASKDPAEMLETIIGGVDTDAWNAGNKRLAARFRNVHTVRSANDVIAKLFKPGLEQGAASRARTFQDAFADSRARMTGAGRPLSSSATRLREAVNEGLSENIIPNILKRAKRLKAIRGVGLVGAGVSIPVLAAETLKRRRARKS